MTTGRPADSLTVGRYIQGLLLAVVVPVTICSAPASANEVCRFVGTTDYSGQAAITTNVATTGDVTRVDVAITFHAKRMYLIDIQYLLEEVSTWRAGALQSVSVNNRYAVDDHIVRQLWDDFQRGSDGL